MMPVLMLKRVQNVILNYAGEELSNRCFSRLAIDYDSSNLSAVTEIPYSQPGLDSGNAKEKCYDNLYGFK
jgi:hypothetical protein